MRTGFVGQVCAAAPVAQRYQVPMITPSSTNERVTEVGDYIFRVCFIDPFQGTVMALFAKNTLKAKNVAVLTDAAAPYSVGLATFFKEKFLADGGTIFLDEVGDMSLKTQAKVLRALEEQRLEPVGRLAAR